MSNFNATNLKALSALPAAGGAAIAPSLDPTNGWGVVIPSAGTYMFPFGSILGGVPQETPELSLSAKWTATLAGVLTLEVCNFPQTLGDAGVGGADISDIDTSPAWQQYNPTPSGSTYASATGTGNSLTGLALTLGGTNVGGAGFNLPDISYRRMRAKLVASAAGTIRLLSWGKLGA